MSPTLVDQSNFSLRIGRLEVLLSSKNADLMEQVRRRYRNFSGAGDYLHKVALHLSKDFSGNSEEQITITDKGLFVTHQTYEGSVDFEKNTSEIRANDVHPLADVEYFLRLVYAVLSFQAGGFLLHSAGILRDEAVYLFIGPSGSGKSTVANLSAQEHVLNDDLVMVLPQLPLWIAYATPFWNYGKGVDAQPMSATLAIIYRLVKDKDNFVEPITRGEALAELVASIPVLSRASPFSTGLLQRCLMLMDQVPVYRLHFLPDRSFWDVIPQS